MGRKYSLFLSEGSKTYFEPLVTKGVEYSITNNSIAIIVEAEHDFIIIFVILSLLMLLF